jgi:hypothetical protein
MSLICFTLSIAAPPAFARVNLNQFLRRDRHTPIYLPPRPAETIPYSPAVYIRWKTAASVMLRWTDKSSVESGFRVEQKGSEGQWAVVEVVGPVQGNYLSQAYEIPGLTPNTDYCFRVVAFNDEGDSGAASDRGVCTQTTAEGGCSGEKIEEVLALASRSASSVSINCDLSLEPNQVVTKRLIFEGPEASGVTTDLNGAILNGGTGTYNEGRDMVEVRARETVVRNQEGVLSTYQRPRNITVKNGRIIGSVRVWGMARNGEGDPEYETKLVYDCTSYQPCRWVERVVEIPGSNQFKKSSSMPGHTVRAQMNAPTQIAFDNLTIVGVSRNPLYFAPGVTQSTLMNSEMSGKSNAVAIYLDAESADNVIKNNYIHVATKNHIFEQWDRPLIAVDGSRDNKIINNFFSNLSHGGIYFYRNCGEGGVIRHSAPSHNQIINNIFYYNKYKGDNPSVYLGSRDRGGWFQDTFGFCEDDAGYPFGSSVSDKDYARYNVVMQNQIYKRSLSDMIKTKNPSVNFPNYIADNETVTVDTVDNARPAGCYVEIETRGFISHGESFEIFHSRCEAYDYRCDDGDLVRTPIATSPSICVPPQIVKKAQ